MLCVPAYLVDCLQKTQTHCGYRNDYSKLIQMKCPTSTPWLIGKLAAEPLEQSSHHHPLKQWITLSLYKLLLYLLEGLYIHRLG